MFDNYTEQLFEMITRCKEASMNGTVVGYHPDGSVAWTKNQRTVSGGSKAAAASTSGPREWWYDKDGVLQSRPVSAADKSKAASTVVQDINVNKAKVIADFLSQGY